MNDPSPPLYKGAYYPEPEVERAIREAVQAEREACAKLAEDQYHHHRMIGCAAIANAVAHYIAAAIRARGEE